jgi:glucose 1-dehydrogenase
MLEQGADGAIVNIGSVSSHRPQPNNAAYVAAKHGVIGLTKVASLERSAGDPRQHRLPRGDRHPDDPRRARDHRADRS